MVNRNDTFVSNADPELMGTVQDTGIRSTEGVITGVVTGALARTNAARRYLRTAMIRPQTSVANRFGLMGFEIDQLPEWNVKPSNVVGASIITGEVSTEYQSRTRVEFILRVRIAGKRGAAPDYRWDR